MYCEFCAVCTAYSRDLEGVIVAQALLVCAMAALSLKAYGLGRKCARGGGGARLLQSDRPRCRRGRAALFGRRSPLRMAHGLGIFRREEPVRGEERQARPTHPKAIRAEDCDKSAGSVWGAPPSGEASFYETNPLCTAQQAARYDAILANIDIYDGTSKGQKVIE